MCKMTGLLGSVRRCVCTVPVPGNACKTRLLQLYRVRTQSQGTCVYVLDNSRRYYEMLA